MFTSNDYAEAFKQLNILNESLNEADFNLSASEAEDIRDFLSDDTENTNALKVVDLDAEDEKDLDTDNVGKIVLQCPCCQTLTMKNADEIVLPESQEEADDLLIDSGDACPVCFSEEGFKIVGKVAPYEEVTVEVEKKDVDDVEAADKAEEAEEFLSQNGLDTDDNSIEFMSSVLNSIDADTVKKIMDLGCAACTEDSTEDEEDEYEDADLEDADEEDYMTESLLEDGDTSSSSNTNDISNVASGGNAHVTGGNVSSNNDNKSNASNSTTIHISGTAGSASSKTESAVGTGSTVAGAGIGTAIGGAVGGLPGAAVGGVIGGGLGAVAGGLADHKLGEGKEKKAPIFVNKKAACKDGICECGKTEACEKEEYLCDNNKRSGRCTESTNEINAILSTKKKESLTEDGEEKEENFDESISEGYNDQNFDIPGLEAKIISTPDENISAFNDEEQDYYLVEYSRNGKVFLTLAITPEDEAFIAYDAMCELGEKQGKLADFWYSHGIPCEDRFRQPFDQVAVRVQKVLDNWIKPNWSKTKEKEISYEESLTEGLNDVQLETDTDKISIHAEAKNNGDEMIAPLDFQAANEIVDAQPEDEEDTEYLDDVQTEDEVENEEESDEAVDMENADEEIPEDELTDVDIEDVDEEAFDQLGESFFTSSYDNVKGYKTESIRESGNKLVCEGLITFASGNQRKTQFVVEGDTIDANGNCSLLVENAQLTPGQKAIKMTGKLKNNKLIPESLSFDYNHNGTKLFGTANTH